MPQLQNTAPNGRNIYIFDYHSSHSDKHVRYSACGRLLVMLNDEPLRPNNSNNNKIIRM